MSGTFAQASTPQATDYKIKAISEARFDPKESKARGDTWFKWKLWLECYADGSTSHKKATKLAKGIKSVKYELDSSFVDFGVTKTAVHTREEKPWELVLHAYAPYLMPIQITFVSGKSMKIDHQIVFPEPKKEPKRRATKEHPVDPALFLSKKTSSSKPSTGESSKAKKRKITSTSAVEKVENAKKVEKTSEPPIVIPGRRSSRSGSENRINDESQRILLKQFERFNALSKALKHADDTKLPNIVFVLRKHKVNYTSEPADDTSKAKITFDLGTVPLIVLNQLNDLLEVPLIE
eukprot:m.144090 g.144090  ORF g.144090 m.144090 type:complete len:293 (-) comp14910_c0_seq10:950-1828(-)